MPDGSPASEGGPAAKEAPKPAIGKEKASDFLMRMKMNKLQREYNVKVVQNKGQASTPRSWKMQWGLIVSQSDDAWSLGSLVRCEYVGTRKRSHMEPATQESLIGWSSTVRKGSSRRRRNRQARVPLRLRRINRQHRRLLRECSEGNKRAHHPLRGSYSVRL